MSDAPDWQLADASLSPASEAPGPERISHEDRLEAFHQHRPLLFSIAYRMLGSAADAEDMLQETYIRWQRTGATDIASPKAFLVTIVSRLCINYLQLARVKREHYFGQWLPEPLMTIAPDDLLPDTPSDETISIAFLMLMERLTPLERAVFLLREVFEYEYAEIARIVNQNEAYCRQILRRARQHVKRSRTRFEASPEQHAELLQRFVDASSSGDMDALVSLLSDDIVLYSDGGGKAVAVPNAIYGPQKVARLLFGAQKKLLPGDSVIRITQVNGRLGVIRYFNGRPFSVLSIRVTDGVIRNIYIVSNPEKLNRLPCLSQLPS